MFIPVNTVNDVDPVLTDCLLAMDLIQIKNIFNLRNCLLDLIFVTSTIFYDTK